MQRLKSWFQLWWPAILMMAIIFAFSAQASSALPNFAWADALVKKGAHMIGYGILAWSTWRGLRFETRRRWLAWLFAVAYALTDEAHQSFVPGRHPSPVDILLFDGLGAFFALILWSRFIPSRGASEPVNRPR